MSPKSHYHLIFDKSYQKTNVGEKTASLTNGIGKTGCMHVE
jgi:hypothetical protein